MAEKGPSVFQTRNPFIQRLEAALRNQWHVTGTPTGNADVTLHQENTSVHPKPWSRQEALPRVLSVVFPQDPPSRVGTAGRLFVPFEGHKAPTMLSPTAWSLPFWPSAAPLDMELLGGKANRNGARRAGEKMGCYQVLHL